MNEATEPWKDLVDDYLNGVLDDVGIRRLEDELLGNAEARAYYVRYARMHTDLYLETRAARAGIRALDSLAGLATSTTPTVPTSSRMPFIAAAVILLVAGLAWWLIPNLTATDTAIAWLVNAQNCKWSGGEPPGHMSAKTILGIEQGLAEVRFKCGARVVIEAPARFELLSAMSARLQYGKLTAKVPPTASGFEILSPQGKVIDLGTEFGVVVSEKGATEVYVFEGKVDALPVPDGEGRAATVRLIQNQSAQIAEGRVTIKEVEPKAGPGQFVREIVAPPVLQPRKFHLTFDRDDLEGIQDRNGKRIGLTHRLPGTGARIKPRDPNLRLDPAKKQLELVTTNSDLNTQYMLWRGEYFGIPLSRLGFTGKQDFAVTTKIVDIPALEFIGQFGLYAGAQSDKSIRGGLLSSKRGDNGEYTQFLVNNSVRNEDEPGVDYDIGKVGLLSTGVDLQLTLKRIAGKYSLTVDNLTNGTSSTLTIRHPEFLDNENELYVGLFGANTQSNVRRTLLFKEFEVTVWAEASPE